MKQNEKKIMRGTLSIAVFFILFLLFLMSCGSKDSNKDLITNLTIAQILAGSGEQPLGKAEFRLSNTNSLLSTRSSNVQQFRTLSATSYGLLTDLSGNNPQNYGDGTSDGFTDHFITPIAAALDICQIVAYKSREKGGPEPGNETLENASLILYDAAVIFQNVNEKERKFCDYVDKFSLVPEKQTARVDIKTIPIDQRADYDRIGIIASSLTYAFSPNDVPEDAYRYMSLELNNSYRGEIITDIFYDGCPNSFLNSPRSYFNEGTTNDWVEGNTCTVRPGMIDSNSGIFLLNSEEYFTNPNRYKNPPLVNSGVADTESKRLKYKKPSSMDTLRSSDPYIMVLNLGEGSISNLFLDVSMDNVLFWDSNAPDNQFSPQLDVQDRPNATSGADNLTNTSRKNMILHLPTILSSKK
ncbi:MULTISPECIES: sigma factor sigX-regulated lipoprotein SrpA [Leptospira]|uniref:Lipoprotein n=1 Tax=Leptospira borgpetersenii str. Brem 328 TaxID=1049780 RepID=A0ABC9SFZ9_LEPBO|nr:MULTISPECIES: hypothetical protein [Leptospira]EMK13654.1 putative lipoprotein [Leptospira sp. serovar Kenya str. Sh9]EMN11425.1 putative lipoprotein [Leptospira borgpetersenii str. Brem 307]EMN16729.1 putative lipoprotein [Leptospira borgpetersenii str. Brem 328]